MKELRKRVPLLFALAAALLAILCFQFIPGWNSFFGLIDAGTLRQSAAAAIVVAVLYLFSGECLLEERAVAGKPLQVMHIAALVAGTALVLGIARIMVQKSTITPPQSAVLIFIAMLFATAVFEEMLFRGLFFEAFVQELHSQGRQHYLLWAAVLSSVLFGLLHVSSDLGSLFRATAYIQAGVKVAEATCFGLAMCALYAKTRSIWPAVGLHAAFDVISELPIYLATGVQTSTYITGSPADIAVLAVATAVLALPAKWAIDWLRAQD